MRSSTSLNGGIPAIWWSDDLQDDIALLGADHVRNFARLHGKRLIFKFLGQGPALENAQVAALRSGGTVGIFLRHIFKAGSGANLLEQIVGLSFGRRQSGSVLRLFGGGIGSAILAWGGSGRLFACRFLGSDQDLAESDRLGLLHLALVLVVKLLLFLLGDGEVWPTSSPITFCVMICSACSA